MLKIYYENIIKVALSKERRAIPLSQLLICFYVGFVIDFAQCLRDAPK